ncbi:MAG: hypothetical protein ACOYK1_06285 [Vampirovibrionia bacterium]
MVDLSVLRTFNPVDPSVTKNSSGEGITFQSELDTSLSADELARKIQTKAATLEDKAKQLELVERSIAYIRAKGDSDLSLKVYENLKDEDKKNGSLDVFGTADQVPDIVNKSAPAQVAWEKMASGAAYDYIEQNKTSIAKDLQSARSKAGDKKILKIADNPALVNLKKQLLESGMSPEEADKDISKMLQETNDSNGKSLLAKDESVKIEIESSSTTSSNREPKTLEEFKSQLITEINKPGTTPEQVKAILSRSVDKFEKFRPKDNIEPEIFYSEQMQDVLKRSDNYKDYSVAATASLRKEGGLIKTTNKEVFVNRDGKFVNDEGRIYKVVDDEIEVNGKKINIKDIKASEPKISIVMDQDRAKVENKTLELGGLYIEDQKLVHKARGDQYAQDRLDDRKGILDEARAAVKAKRDREGKSGSNDTLTSIIGIVSALATIVAALSGGGRTTSITGGADYNGQNGYGYGSYGQNGGGDPRISDKYGYNRGYQATIDAAYERSNQYLSTMQFNPYLPPGVTNTAVSTRARTIRNAGMDVIQGRPPRV